LNDVDVPLPTAADEEEVIFILLDVLVGANVEVLVDVLVIVFELVVKLVVVVFEPEELFVLREIFFEVDVAVDPLFVLLLTVESSNEMDVIEGSAPIGSSRIFLVIVGDESGDALLLTRFLSEPD